MRRYGAAKHPEGLAAVAEAELSKMASFRSSTRRHCLLGSFRVCAAVLCISLALAVIGCKPYYPPDTSVMNPSVAFDGRGNVLTAYQTNDGRGPVTYLQKLNPDGERLWGERGVRLDERQPEPKREREGVDPKTLVFADRDGNMTVFWAYEHQILAKKLDAEGNLVWKTRPPAVGSTGPTQDWTVLSNAITGPTVVWLDSGHLLRLQSVDDGGNFLWPELPHIASVTHFDAACDRAGNTWVVWAEPYTEAIKLQVFDPAGHALWPTGKELQEGLQSPTQVDNHGKYGLVVTPNQSGGVVVLWKNLWESLPLMVRSIDAEGRTLWSATNEDFPSYSGEELNDDVLGDSRGGVFCFWETDQVVLAQHIDGQGTIVWGARGMAVGGNQEATGYSGFYYSVGTDSAGGVFIAWCAPGSYPVKHFAQRIDAAGNGLWPGKGVTVGTAAESGRLSITASSDAVFFSSGTPASGESRVQKLDMSGRLLWGENGIRLDDWRERDTGIPEKQ